MTALKVDPDGNVYILEGDNNYVKKWSPGASDGIIVTGDSGTNNSNNRIQWSQAMFIDFTTMVIWIAETSNDRIIKWTSPTRSEVVCGGYGSDNNQLNFPQGLFVDINASNTLYVADTNNHRIQMWLPGESTGITAAGITNYYGNSASQLWYPRTLIVDSNRDMFIADAGNNRIMRWTVGSSVGVVIANDLMCENTFIIPVQRLLNINFDLNGTLFVLVSPLLKKFSITCRKYLCFANFDRY